MIGVILAVLKWVGIVLLWIIGILFIFTFIVCFMPIRYRVEGTYNSENKLNGNLHITWLLGSIFFKLQVVQNEIRMALRLLGIKVFVYPDTGGKRKSKKRNRHKTLDANDNEDTDKDELYLEEVEETIIDKVPEIVEEIADEAKDALGQIIYDEKLQEEEEDNKGEEEKELEESNDLDTIKGNEESIKKKKQKHKLSISSFNPLKWIHHIILKIVHTVREKWKNLKKAIKKGIKKVVATKHFIQDKENQETFKRLWRHLKGTIKYILPTKKKIKIKFGTGDPAFTGQILGFIGIIYPILREDYIVIPDFENKIFEGEFKFKGRIRLIFFIIICFKLWRDKNFMKMLKNILNH